MDFFDFSKEFKPVVIEGSETEEKLKTFRMNIVHEDQTKEHKGTEYARKYQEEEERKLQGVCTMPYKYYHFYFYSHLVKLDQYMKLFNNEPKM